MRAILDAILAFIGAESLTDSEFDSIDLEDASNDVDNYNALLAILDLRESVSSMQDRLRYYYLAKGVSVSEVSSGKSNILVGAELC